MEPTTSTTAPATATPRGPADPRCVAERLTWHVRWMRRTLETLERSKEVRAEPWIHTNVHGLLRACDRETNPRLRKCLEDLDLSANS